MWRWLLREMQWRQLTRETSPVGILRSCNLRYQLSVGTNGDRCGLKLWGRRMGDVAVDFYNGRIQGMLQRLQANITNSCSLRLSLHKKLLRRHRKQKRHQRRHQLRQKWWKQRLQQWWRRRQCIHVVMKLTSSCTKNLSKFASRKKYVCVWVVLTVTVSLY